MALTWIDKIIVMVFMGCFGSKILTSLSARYLKNFSMKSFQIFRYPFYGSQMYWLGFANNCFISKVILGCIERGSYLGSWAINSNAPAPVPWS